MQYEPACDLPPLQPVFRIREKILRIRIRIRPNNNIPDPDPDPDPA